MKKKKDDSKWLMEFTKKVVVYVCVTYTVAFFIALAAAVLTLLKDADSTMMQLFWSESSDAFKTLIIGYCAKAGIENFQKIKQKREQQQEQDEQAEPVQEPEDYS